MTKNILFRSILAAILLLAASVTAGAQAFHNGWQKATQQDLRSGKSLSGAERFIRYYIAESTLQAQLAKAGKDYELGIMMDLPAPDGSFRSFRIWNTPVMAEELAKQFPEISSYTAEAVGAPHITAKLDYSPAGFHALVFDASGSYFIEPYNRESKGDYVVFYKKDIAQDALAQGVCGVNDVPKELPVAELGESGQTAMRINGNVRRKYRLALACTGEYAAAVAGPNPTTGAVLAKLTNVVNQLNGVFEREFSLTLELVANETSIIYLNAATDPYTNSNTSVMLGENQTNLDTRIGSANYDIGHALNVSGLGLGQLGCVCTVSKARGVSFNSGAKTFEIVLHEMGHQFNSHHTFNGSSGSCSENGNASTAFEPGGGSTIMGYPGLCATDNIQSYRDLYYHGKSLELITTHIANTSTCPTLMPAANTNAVIPPFSATYSIPFKTPFELTAPVPTDATKDTLTWCWEQRDLGSFGMSLALTTIYGPLFRTFPPATSRTRVFPRLETLIGRLPLNGEKLPEVPRSLAFRVTERDIYQGWGAFNYPDDSIRLNVIDTKVPFSVSYPVGGEQIAAGSRPAIRWIVAGTTAAPISCPIVSVYLSVDSGMTYPYLILANTPNDGAETVLLPNIATTTKTRIKVKCNNNVFFNISATNFTLYQGSMGAEQAYLEDGLQITPNPARDVLNIDLPLPATLQAQVFNMVGQLVWSGSIDQHASLDVSTWARGMYQLRIFNGAGVQLRRKVVVQ